MGLVEKIMRHPHNGGPSLNEKEREKYPYVSKITGSEWCLVNSRRDIKDIHICLYMYKNIHINKKQWKPKIDLSLNQKSIQKNGDPMRKEETE